MKTISKIGWVASLCLLGLSAQAQFLNDFYHFTGIPADHGDGQKVLTTRITPLTPTQMYATAGTSPANVASDVPSVFLTVNNLSGDNIFHKAYLLNTPKSTNIDMVKGLVQVTHTTTAGYALLAYTNASPAQSVVIKTDLNGNVVWKSEVGSQIAASLAYDFDLNRLLVLTRESSGSTADLQLVVLRASDGSVVFTEHFDGFNKSDDEPARVLYDGFTHDYLLIGTSLVKNILGTESSLMLVRTTNAGTLVYTRTIGLNGINVTAVDATLNPKGVLSDVVIGGLVVGFIQGVPYVGQPSYTAIDVRTGLNANLNLLFQNFALKALTIVPEASSLDIVGNHPVVGPFNVAKLFSVDPTDPTFVGSIHDYNTPFTSFTFNGINRGPGVNLVMTGAHRASFPIGGSPAGTSFEWLATADNTGTGKCDVADTLSSFQFALPVETNNVTGVLFEKTAVTVETLEQTEDKIDGCDVPFRLPQTNEVAKAAGFRVYPNPASELVQMEYTTAQSDNVELNLIDITGRVVLSQRMVGGENMTASVNVSDLSAGVYYTDFRVNGASVNKNKLVVQH
jgi:hypothetical protein